MAKLEAAPYETYDQWLEAWNDRSVRIKSQPDIKFQAVAAQVAGKLRRHGFELFRNGGMPLLERRSGHYREEIVFMPAPGMSSRPDLPFAVNLRLSSETISQIRSRFWRPACRAPRAIASGNVGFLLEPPRHYIFSAQQPRECAAHVSDLLEMKAMEWFSVFHSPWLLKNRLYGGSLPLLDDATAVELLLLEFSRREAQRYVQFREFAENALGAPIAEKEGFDLYTDRMAPIRAYYKI